MLLLDGTGKQPNLNAIQRSWKGNEGVHQSYANAFLELLTLLIVNAIQASNFYDVTYSKSVVTAGDTIPHKLYVMSKVRKICAFYNFWPASAGIDSVSVDDSNRAITSKTSATHPGLVNANAYDIS